MDLLAYDPVTGFAQVYKEQFTAAADDFFEKAVQEGKIDVSLNEQLSGELKKLQARKEKMDGRYTGLIALLIVLAVALVIWGCWISSVPEAERGGHWAVFVPVLCGAAALTLFKIIPAIRNLSRQIALLEQQIQEKYARIRGLLEPLWNFFDWDTVTNLIGKVLPPLQFDKFLSRERLQDFSENFGFTLADDPDSTLSGICSGTFYGYPFVFSEEIVFSMGEKVWSNSITITYSERVTGADGKTTTVTRTQTLTATIVRPCPEYDVYRNFFFGHDAAPELSFSRSPSSLSGGKGFLHTLGKKFQLRKLRKFEQNLTDESQYTMVANHDFEVLFRSENRNHEVGFRLLYTPLAQQYMVSLLNDRTAGYGDDFAYFKNGCMTRIWSEHLSKTLLSGVPFDTELFELKEIKKLFLEGSVEFFRSLYFTFAPLMLIPAYNEPRLHTDDFAGGSSIISECELEGAVYFQKSYFVPEGSITETIFNIRNFSVFDHWIEATVVGCSFSGRERVEYVEKWGADGKLHSIPVYWTEYIPIRSKTKIRAWREEEAPPPRTAALYSRRGIVIGRE